MAVNSCGGGGNTGMGGGGGAGAVSATGVTGAATGAASGGGGVHSATAGAGAPGAGVAAASVTVGRCFAQPIRKNTSTDPKKTRPHRRCTMASSSLGPSGEQLRCQSHGGGKTAPARGKTGNRPFPDVLCHRVGGNTVRDRTGEFPQAESLGRGPTIGSRGGA